MSTNLSLSPGINLIRGPVENLEALVFDTKMIHNQIEKNSFGTHSGTCFLWALRHTSDFYFRLLTGTEFHAGDDFSEKCGKLFGRLTIVPVIGIVLKTSAVALWALTMTAASLERFIIKAKDDEEIEQRQTAFANAIRKDQKNHEVYRWGLHNNATVRSVYQLDINLPGEKLF